MDWGLLPHQGRGLIILEVQAAPLLHSCPQLCSSNAAFRFTGGHKDRAASSSPLDGI